ncbi:MAG: hypothetical protein C0402_02185 [Thermodesulfovibrio sp.]|nr:hypothetical protein [Thermodesulfovibrio sp.]
MPEQPITNTLVIGRLIALFVHETNNHLATLGESAGLGDDILCARNLSDKDKLKELEKLLSAMGDRIGHAASLVRTFGELGRCMENPAATIDVSQAIEGILPFLEKLARQKNARISIALDRKLPAAAGNCSELQCLVLALFDNFCAALEPNAMATISAENTSSSVMLNLTADCPAAAVTEKQFWPWSSLETFARANGFKITRQQRGGAVTIELRIPS